jgi:hypothetical protein
MFRATMCPSSGADDCVMLSPLIVMCCNSAWCYTDMSHCEWAVCGYGGYCGWWFHCCVYFNLITRLTTPTYSNETTTHNKPHNHTQPTHSETYLYNTTHCYSAYQYEAITSRCRHLLMMGTWLPETCWATSRKKIKNTKVTSSWFFLSTLNYNARLTKHQINKMNIIEISGWTYVNNIDLPRQGVCTVCCVECNCIKGLVVVFVTCSQVHRGG